MDVDANEIGRHLDALMQIATENNGIRAAGTTGYAASRDYVAQQLTDLGFTVTRSPFTFTFFDEAEPVSLIVGDHQWTGAEWLHAMLYSAGGNVAGVLQTVDLSPDGFVTGTGGCEATDWAGFVAGHIALVGSAPCFRRDQILLAQDAGALGVIALYPHWEANMTRRPTLFAPDGITIPAVVAGSEPSTALLAAAAAGRSAQLTSTVTMSQQTNDNVIAERAGSTDDVVILGAHLDSVLDGPGINDNGSGVATLLSLAQPVSAFPLPLDKTVRFAFWGAEEYGELGSTAYVDSLSDAERARVTAYLNVDMDASPNAARFVYNDADAPATSDPLVQQLLDALAADRTPAEVTDVGGASDHHPFALAGIPVAGVFSGLAPLSPDQAAQFGGQAGVPADACYHLACDTRDNINLESAVTLGNAVGAVVQELAFAPRP